MSQPRNPVTVPVPPRRRGRVLRPLLLLTALAIALVAAASWTKRAVQAMDAQQALVARLDAELDALRQQAAQLESRQGQLTQSLERSAAGDSALTGRIDRAEDAIAGLAETVDGGRTRVQLAAVEQLLLMASDRLLLARDAAGALRAFELADERLATLRDPRLHRLREVLAQERATVAELVAPDAEGAAIAIGRLLAEASQYPLRVQIPERFEAPPVPEEPEGEGAWSRAVSAVRLALAQVFALRRLDGEPPRLLSADEAALVVQVLQLKLEGARLALLAADGRTFRDLVRSARDWLESQYDRRDARVQAASRELERLAGLDLAPEPPALGRTLAQLRAHLGAPPP